MTLLEAARERYARGDMDLDEFEDLLDLILSDIPFVPPAWYLLDVQYPADIVARSNALKTRYLGPIR